MFRSLLPAPASASRLSTRNAYVRVLGLYAVVAVPYLWTAIATLAASCGVDIDLARVERIDYILTIAVLWGAATWLGFLLLDRMTGLVLWASLAADVGLVGLPAVFGHFGGGLAQFALPLVQLVLIVWLTLSVVMPYALRASSRGSAAERRTGWWLLTGAATGAFIASIAIQVLARALPGPQGAQAPAEGAAENARLVAHILWSGTVEELVATAAVVVLLAAARRPLWECVTVSALMRALPHLYMGTIVLAPLALGIACALLYHRYRRVTPLIVAHLTFDLLLFLPKTYHTATMGLLAFACVIAVTMLDRVPRTMTEAATSGADADRSAPVA